MPQIALLVRYVELGMVLRGNALPFISFAMKLDMFCSHNRVTIRAFKRIFKRIFNRTFNRTFIRS